MVSIAIRVGLRYTLAVQKHTTMSKQILIIVANPATSSTTGWPVGYWAAELIHPYDVLSKAGHEITIASPAGGEVKADPMSDPGDPSGYSAWDSLSKAYLERPDFRALLAATPAISTLDLSQYDALIVAGGQSPMFTFEQAEDLHAAFANFYQTGKPTAALCHGTAVLRYAKDAAGMPLVAGKTITGFTNAEEDKADKAVGQKVMPWRIEEELSKLGAHFVQGGVWEAFATQDGNLITGQQQMSGAKVAELVNKSLG